MRTLRLLSAVFTGEDVIVRISMAMLLAAILTAGACKSLYADPILFNNSLAFYGHPYTALTFDDASQDSQADVNTYLAPLGATFSLWTGAAISPPYRGQLGRYWTVPVSAPNLLIGQQNSPGYGGFTLTFADPVKAAGFFAIGFYGPGGTTIHEVSGLFADDTPFSYTLDEAGIVWVHNDVVLDQSVNGFFGLYNEVGIKQFGMYWSHDAAGLDNIYFGNEVTLPQPDGGVFPFDPSSPLPPPGIPTPESLALGGEVPEPSTLLLLLPLAGFWLRKMRGKR